MSSTAKRLSGPAQLANAPATVYTAPALTKTIIRHLHVSNPSGAAVGFTLSIGADAAATRLYDAYSIPAAAPGQPASVLDIFTYLVLNPADIVQAFGSVGATLVLELDGQELTLG